MAVTSPSEAPPSSLQVPPRWDGGAPEAQRFAATLRAASQTLLLLDYDGTLAPFRENKMEAVPYEGVVRRLERIVSGGRTAVAFFSGRPAGELLQLLPLAGAGEIWGMHGREHRQPDGALRYFEPSAQQKARLDGAEKHLRAAGLHEAVERKVASVAVHWRAAGMSDTRARQIHAAAREAFGLNREDANQEDAGGDAGDGLSVLPFDGGVELRAADHTKRHAAEDLLRRQQEPAASAFLGDDITDEDAFAAVEAAGGLGLLVRAEARPSRAHFQLHPPAELLRFLDSWVDMAGTRPAR